MKMRSRTPMMVAKLGTIAVSAALCAIGTAMLVWPGMTAVVLERSLGAALTVFGVIKLTGYFSRDLYRLAFEYDLQFGLLFSVLGLVMLLHPGQVLSVTCVAIGIAVLTDSLFKIRTALEARKFGVRSWGVVLTLAIVSCGAGGMMLWPSSSVRVLTTMLGILLIIEGVLNLGVMLSMVKIVKHQKPDVIDVEYEEIM